MPLYLLEPGVRRSLLGLLLVFGLGQAGCTDYNLQRETPEIASSVAALDFGEVVRGTRASLTFNVRNAGHAPLSLEQASLSESSSVDLSLEDVPATTLQPRDLLPVTVHFTPGEAGWDYGELDLVSDDPLQPVLRLQVTGRGVDPEIDVDPETLWFGELAPPETLSLSVDVIARGEGTLRVEAIEPPQDAAFSVVLPESLTLPARFSPGEGFSFEVLFTPSSTAEVVDELILRSNDPDQPNVAVKLIGNKVSGGDDAPVAEITSPNWGTYVIQGESVRLEGVVVDDADPPPNLICAWYAGSTLLGVSTADSSGKVSLDTTALPLGEVVVSLRAVDTGGQMGQDDLDLVVWDQDEPLRYVLSGGNSPYDWFTVDDDITLSVDGVVVFQDSNHTQDHHPPVEFDARPGQTLRVLANDVNACASYLGALTLHWGFGTSQALSETQCRSSCPEDACYDPSFGGPWPNVFFDESFVISIP